MVTQCQCRKHRPVLVLSPDWLCRETYGGTEEYLASIGFGIERQLRLAKSLRPTMAEPL